MRKSQCAIVDVRESWRSIVWVPWSRPRSTIGLSLLCLSETWHDPGSASIQRLRNEGYTMSAPVRALAVLKRRLASTTAASLSWPYRASVWLPTTLVYSRLSI